MNSTFGICNDTKSGFNESINDSKKIKNKMQRFLKLGAMLTAFVIIISFSNLPASQAYTLLLTTPVGLTPNSAVFDPNSGNIYVANFGDNTVSVIDGTTNTSIVIPVGISPIDTAAGNGNIYVANFGSNSVSVISDTTNTVTATIPLGITPLGITFDSTTGNVYVTSYTSNNVLVISGNTVTATIPVGSTPYQITSGNGNVYVDSIGSSNVSVISDTTNTVTATIPVGAYPFGITFDSTTGNVYVANFGDNTVSVISGNTVTATIPVGANPYGITSGNGNVYVANYASNSVSVINEATNTVTDNIGGLTNPTWVAFNSANGNVYVVSTALNNISLFSSSTPTTTPPPPNPTGTPAGDKTVPVFVTPQSAIAVFPTSTLGATVSFTIPQATDEEALSPVTCDHASPSQFSIGLTPVTCYATDASGNTGSTTFNVEVYTPIKASQVVVDQLDAINALKSGTITSLTAKLPYSITLIPGNNWGAKNTLNNFINEVNSKCCSTGLLISSSKPFTADQANKFITEARDIVAATP